MKKVILIDESGLFVTDVIINVGQETPINCIEAPCPDGFYHPKWNGNEWIEGGKQVITKEQLIEQSNQRCEESILKGFYLNLGSGEKHFGCSLENQANIDNLYHTAFLVSQGFPLPQGVNLEYNTSTDECIHPLSFEQCVGLWVAKNAHVYKHRKACQDEKLAILNAN